MDTFYVYDQNLAAVAIVEEFESFIWTDRYRECGDFEIYCAPTTTALNTYKKGYFIKQADSEHAMIIESVKIETDAKEGSHMTVTGRSLEAILDRRIVWDQTILNGSLQEGIQTLLNNAIISPSNEKRKISNFMFVPSNDARITAMTIGVQYRGENLYSIITELCETYGIGFKITLDSTNHFVFRLYDGVDRSYSQNTNPYVVFSYRYENLLDSRYLDDDTKMKNVALVGGEGEGSERKTATVHIGDSAAEPEGLQRRELFVDSSTKSTTSEESLTPEQYQEELQMDGLISLAENLNETHFDGSIAISELIIPGKNYNLGDIVQLENEYGHQGRVRITEIISCWDDDGYSLYPTFETVTE